MKHNYVPGKAYKMRNGEKTFYIGENLVEGVDFPLVFSGLSGGIHSMRYDGTYAQTPNQPHKYDIIGEWPPEPKKVKGWVNVYSLKCLEGLASCENVWPSKEKANKEASRNRIACIPIEFTEGEGL